MVDVAAGRVVLAVADGPALLAELATRLAASGLRVADLALRRPSLEDVFLTLTSHPGSETTEAEDEDGHPAVAGNDRAPAERSAA
jgi:hypothetical protein